MMFYNKKFSNNPQDFFKNIDKLPYEMLDIIYSYTPKSVTTFLSKTIYLKDHHLLRQTINSSDIENYIRTMVRQDNDFVFEQLLNENTKKWLNMKQYYHRDCIYLNYLYFLHHYAMDNESIKCQKLLNKLFEELGLSKNQHKKNITKYIRWKT